MSRTKRGSKHCGYEYWGPRPFSGGTPGKETKTITHRIERRRNKDDVRKALKDAE